MALHTSLKATTIKDAKPLFTYATNTDGTGTIDSVIGTANVLLIVDNDVYKDSVELANCLTRMAEYITEQAKISPKHATS